MLIRLTKQLGEPRSGMRFDDREQRDVLVVGRKNRRVFRCIQRTDAMRRSRGLTRCVLANCWAGELDGWIGWPADGMKHRLAAGLPGMPRLHNTCNYESARFFWQIQAGGRHVSEFKQIKNRVGQHSIKNMDAISGAGGRIDIGRNALGTAEKSTYSDRTDAVIRPRSSIDRPLQLGVAAIRRADGPVLLHADRSAAIRIAALDCEGLRNSAKDVQAAGFVGVRQKGARQGISGKRGENELWNLPREGRVSRLVKYLFHHQTSVRHEREDSGELLVCFGPQSPRDARAGFAEAWWRGTNVYGWLRSLRQRVEARVLDIAQELSHGQGGFAKRAVMVEHPSGQHCFGGFFQPLIDQNGDFSAEICGVVQPGQFKALQRSA